MSIYAHRIRTDSHKERCNAPFTIIRLHGDWYIIYYRLGLMPSISMIARCFLCCDYAFVSADFTILGFCPKCQITTSKATYNHGYWRYPSQSIICVMPIIRESDDGARSIECVLGRFGSDSVSIYAHGEPLIKWTL